MKAPLFPWRKILNREMPKIMKKSPEVLAVPVREVADFVASEIKSYNELSGKKPIWAEDFDAFNRERFVYIVGMDVGIALYFDQNKK